MAKVIITKELRERILTTFKARSHDVVGLLETVAENPQKGKAIGHVKNIVIKELKFEKWRFYCITDGHVLKFGTAEQLASLLVKFVKMSDKKDQQKTIEEIRSILLSMGFERF